MRRPMADSPSDKRPPPQPHLLDLSSDCLRIILRLLAPRDVCTVSLVCSRLAALAVEVSKRLRYDADRSECASPPAPTDHRCHARTGGTRLGPRGVDAQPGPSPSKHCAAVPTFHLYHAPSAQDEAAWECFCAQSLEGQDRQSPGELPNFDTPATLRRQLGLRSFRALYQVRWRVQASILA